MRFTNVAAAAGIVIAVLLIVPVVLMGAPSARADISGYRRCIGTITEIPLSEPNPQSQQLAGLVAMDLKAGVSPAAEARKLEQTGFDSRVANGVVQCVIQENP
ncbi:hypothetical protein A5747_03645 [Mycobacterium sp. IS-836]|uniref:hypothetical protein n=1 Tax=Mycobacterium sp. IS-836 TaxID=1834160 RepID=UPI00096F128B|nr:hypothetical protein [Mycobacterium sp. IS-836]OMC57465.1 hypothetical protein A5747_03645 [Mycobacterium sp. IS-836]